MIGKRFCSLVIGLSMAAVSWGQSVVSAKSGILHYLEGDVRAGGEPVQTKLGGRYAELKEGQRLVTGEGRAEVLLTPGVFLRVGENSEVLMISNRLADTRVELMRGMALVEVAEALKDTSVTVLAGGVALTFAKSALVQIDAAAAVRVYKGQLHALAGSGEPVQVKEGRQLMLDGTNKVVKFDTDETDALYRWASRRTEYIAMANIASANMARRSGMQASAFGWYYNPYFGMLTYLPYGNMYRSPFGYFFYNPRSVHGYYESYLPAYRTPANTNAGFSQQGPRWNSDNGYYVNTRGGMANPSTSAPTAAPATGAEPAAAGRGADTAVGRGGGEGGPR